MFGLLTTYDTTYYNKLMLKTYLYIPDDLERQILNTALTQKKSKAEVMRKALEKGIAHMQQQGTVSAEALLKIADVGERYNPQGPKDLSTNMNKYLWGIEENNE